MSYSHTKRRKTIKKFKKKFGPKWLGEFQKHCDDCRRKLDGPLIGNLEEIINSVK